MSVKIHSVQSENVKRVKAVSFEVTEKGLTVIGGRNAAGKTSVLDSIAWALGGEKFRPSDPNNHDGEDNAQIRVELSNGLIAERKGKNGSLTVTDPSGGKGGQTILNDVIEMLALDLPRFMQASSKQKAKTLLDLLGVQDELQKLEEREKELYSEREAHGRHAKQAAAYAEELPFYDDAPEKPVSVQELLKKQQAVLQRNAENQAKRDKAVEFATIVKAEQSKQEGYQSKIAEKEKRIQELQEEIKDLQGDIAESKKVQTKAEGDLKQAKKTAAELEDESTEAIEQQLTEIEETNKKVSANQEKAKAEDRAAKLQEQYTDYTGQIATVRKQITGLLEDAKLPLPGLTVSDGELLYQGDAWDCMSGADQLKVATAIVRALNPECGFVLVDKLEQMDFDTLKAFGKWAETEGLQIIGTRVSTGDECTLVIENGTLVVDHTLCPIPGKFNGLKWPEVPEQARRYALENPDEFPNLTDEHYEQIRKSLSKVA